MIEKLKQNKPLLIIFIIAILLIITGVTYSFYKIKLEGQKTHFVSSDLISFTYKESENKISITNMTPVSDTDGKKSNYFEFSVSSNLVKDMSVDYEISILKTSTTNSFNESDIKAYLTDENDNSLVEPVIISELEDNSKITNAKTIYQNNFTYNNSNEKQTHTYRLRIWLKDNVDLSKYTTKTETENGTNVTLENHIFKFKVNVNTYESGAANTLIALTDNKDNSGLYTITHAADSTLQIGANESVTEYRYRGANPKNYVNFNNETWRIIGIFPTDDGTGKIENRIKIVRNESIGEQVWSSTTSTSRTNNWTTARLKSYLNEGITTGSYQNTLLNSSRDMIDNVKYYLGGYTTADIMKDVMYQYERKISGSDYYYGANPNSWVGKIALMYASDYGYASNEECVKTLYNCQSCAGNNWLSNNTNSWLLPQSTNSNAGVFHMKGTYITHYNGSDNYNSDQPLMVFPTLYLKPSVKIIMGNGTSTDPYVVGMDKQDTSGANAPILASNMIPVYYDDIKNVWKKADIGNKDIETRWYNYDYRMWANAVTVKDTNRQTYLNATPGTIIPMNDINTMWVWIPRFNAVTPSNYNGGTKDNPGAIDVSFVKQNETAIDAFTFGDKELSGFWYGKFETSHSTLTTSTTNNNLGCTNETCNNANGIIIKPNVASLRSNNVSNFFFASRSMEQPNNSFGFVSTEVDTHMSKNNEWEAVTYLTQSIYGRCSNSTTCTEVGINNNSSFITGYGAPAGSAKTVANGAYNTALGKDASTTGTIYGIYDMSGGTRESVMGVLADPNGDPMSGYGSANNSGFNGLLSNYSNYTSGVDFPDSKYYNLYTDSSYIGTRNWYSDYCYFADSEYPWLERGGYYYNSISAGLFYYYKYNGESLNNLSSRFVITNE